MMVLQVSRRYRHFESLHRQLRGYPPYRLRLPPKRIFFHSRDAEFVEERRDALDKYLRALLAVAALRGACVPPPPALWRCCSGAAAAAAAARRLLGGGCGPWPRSARAQGQSPYLFWCLVSGRPRCGLWHWAPGWVGLPWPIVTKALPRLPRP